jgi:hypothetical protein
MTPETSLVRFGSEGCPTPAKPENESWRPAGGKDWVPRGTKPERFD